MDVLQRWLNEEVGLSKHVTNFEKDFANGYYFGEIFSKYNLQPDFRSFLNFNSTDSKMNNFARLEPSFKLLSVSFPSKTANEIMEERKSVAAKLLITIRAALANLSEEDRKRVNTPTSFPPLSRSNQQETLQQTQPSTPQTFSPQQTNSPPARSDSPGGTPKKAFRTFESEPSRPISPQRIKTAQPDKEQPPSLQDVKPISVKIDKQKIDMKYQQYVEEKAKKKKQKQTAEATMDVVAGIENFEKTLKNFTYEEPTTQQQQQPPQELFQKTKKPPTQATTRRAGTAPVPEVDENSEETQKYMQRIKKKKDEEQISRQERDKRRRKILLEQQQVQKLLDEKQNEEILLEKLLRQSQEERRLAARIVETRSKSKEIRRNRILREEQYATHRQREFELLLERDAQLGRSAKLEYELKAKLDRELYEQYEARRRVAKQDKHYAICGRIADYLVDIAIKIIEYKKLSDGVEPVKELREWRTLFKAGVPLFAPKKTTSSSVMEKVFSSSEVEAESDSILNERDFLDYLKGKEEWDLARMLADSTTTPSPMVPSPSAPTQLTVTQPPQNLRPTTPSRVGSSQQGRPVTPLSPQAPTFDPHTLIGVPQNNAILGQVVAHLFSIALPQEPPPPPPSMPSFPIRACIIGKHLSGKSKILQKLSETYRVTIISVDRLVSNAIDEGKNTENSELAEIGVQCEQARQEGREIDEQILVNLIVKEIKEIVVRNLGDFRASSGWVIEGFPETVSQAQMLEKALTGYEVPLSPKGKKGRGKTDSGKKKITSAKPANNKRRGSVIAPSTTEETPQAVPDFKSGIDLVVHIDVPDDTIIRRAVGRRLDPQTGITYHLEYSPPPEHKGVHSRLVPVEEAEATSKLYQKMSAFKEELPKLEKWFSRFNNFKEVNGEGSPEEVVSHILDFIEQAATPAHNEGGLEKKASNLTVEIPNGGESSSALVTPATGSTTPPSDAPTPLPAFHLTQPDIEMVQHKPGKDTFDVDLASILLERFLDMEAFYTATAKSIFSRIRKERASILNHLSLLRDDFVVFLKRPHTMQVHIDQFLQSFNDIDNDMRRDSETKQELHQRTDDLRDVLWEMSDNRKAEAEAERKSTNEDGWMSTRLTVMTNTFIALMQLEVNRYVECKRLLKDFCHGCRKMPLEPCQILHIDLPLSGVVPQQPVPALPPADVEIPPVATPGSKPPSRAHTLGGLGSLGVAVQYKKKRDAMAAAAAAAAAAATTGAPAATVPPAANPAVAAVVSVAPSTPKSNKPPPGSAAGKSKLKKKPTEAPPPTKPQFENEPFPDLHAAYTLARDQVTSEAAKKEEGALMHLPVEGVEVFQAFQFEDKIFLSRLERIKECGLRLLKETRAKGEKLASMEDDWLGARFLAEMGAISSLTRVVKETIEREKKLPYYLQLVGDEFVVNEDMLVFEPESAPPPPIPQEITYPERFSSDQITALTQRFSLLAPWGLVAVKDCAELLFSLAATSELGFEYLPLDWQELDLQQFVRLSKLFVRVEAGTSGYIPNSTPAPSTAPDYIDWREFIVFCVFSGSNTQPEETTSNDSTTVPSFIVPDGDGGGTTSAIASAPPSARTTPVNPSATTPLTSTPALTAPSTATSTATPNVTLSTPATSIPTNVPLASDEATTESSDENTTEPSSKNSMTFPAPLPPTMTQLAEMKAAFRGVDQDHDGKVTYAEYLRVPMWFESVTSEFSEPSESGFDSEVYSYFAQKLKRAIFHVFRQPLLQSDEINCNRSSRGPKESNVDPRKTLYGTPKVDYMELLAYFSIDWNEGEGIRKSVWISGDPPGKPLDLEKLVYLLHTQFSSNLQNQPARELLETVASETNAATTEASSLEQLLAVPTGRALVERAYDRFTLKNVKPLLRHASNSNTTTNSNNANSTTNVLTDNTSAPPLPRSSSKTSK